VSKITVDGISSIILSIPESPLDIIVDDNDNVYVTCGKITINDNDNNNTKVKLNLEKKPLETLTTITNKIEHNYIYKICPLGNSSIIDTNGSLPIGLLKDSNGNIYTANYKSHNISNISSDGTVSIFAKDIIHPTLMKLDSYGNIHVTSINTKGIYKITPEGNYTYTNLNNIPLSIAIDSLNNIYISFYKNKYIYIIRSNDSQEIDIFARVKGYVNYMYIDKEDNIYVTDTTNNLYKDKIYFE
jgi:hypothetical protein